jgi:hypothetical protein
MKSYRQVIERQLFRNEYLGKAVLFTKVCRTSTLVSMKPETSRVLFEYIVNDSLISYDFSDSTILAISMKNTDYVGFDEILTSSILLLQTNSVPIISNMSKCNSQLICGQQVNSNSFMGYTIKSGDKQSLEITKSKAGVHYYEKAVKYVCDSLIDQGVFKQPKGFRKILASNFL